MIPTTLDEAVTLLMQLEVTDIGDLTVLKDALITMAFENRVSMAKQPHVARAARLLGTIIDGTSTEAAADLEAVSAALDQALNSETGTVEPTTPDPRKTRERSRAKTPASSLAAEPPPVAGESLPHDTDVSLLREFLSEAAEYIAAAEVALLSLEANPQEAEAVNTVFRAFHTVKGTAAFLGLVHIAEFSHEAESLLTRVRDRDINYGPICADLSLRSVDMLKALLGAVDDALAGDGALVAPDGYHPLMMALSGYDPAAATSDFAPVRPVKAVPRVPSLESAAEASIRVRTDRLDQLINMVGELVIAQTMIAGDPHMAANQTPELTRQVMHAGKIARELQTLSMSMRMVPLRATFQKLARVVRDTATKVGKSVQFTTDGDDVEIDRNLVDVLADPLVHMIRNAVDHGIEPPNDRDRAGKSRTGSVHLSARHASGNVVVDLVDDGGGLRRDRIVHKAIEKGLIESDRGLTDSAVFQLIFAPGFSTAETVTEISGRGVGLDVVRRNLELIRGRLEIESTPGVGTTFSISLPLTLAVTDGMLVRVGAERFVIPLTQIHKSFRPESDMLSTVAGQGEMVLLGGTLMPIVRLHRTFGIYGAIENPLAALLVIVGDGTHRTALMVDELLGQQQVVTKPLGNALGRVPGFSGGAILGDGRVALILDVRETMSLTTPLLKFAS